MGATTTTDPRAVLPLLLALLAASNTGAVGGGSGMTVAADSFVTTLRGDNFQDHVPSRAAGVLVNFYMPWCKYSKQLTLDYELLGHTFQRVRNVEIAKVNCENDKPLCEKHDIKGYPTLKWFPPGSSEGEDYVGGRSSQEMIRFVNSRSGLQARPKQRPNKIRAVDASELSAAVADETMDTLVQFHIPGDEVCAHFEGEYDMLATAVSAEDHIALLTADISANPEFVAEYGVKAVPLVKLFRRNGQGAVGYTGKYTAGALLPWLNGYADTARLLTGVTNSSVGRVAAMDALAERLVRAPPSAWPAIAETIRETAGKLEGEARAFADYYIEAVGDLTSPAGLDLLTSKRLELNARMVSARAAEQRLALLAQRNVIASIQTRAEKANMDPPAPRPPPPPTAGSGSNGGEREEAKEAKEEEKAAASESPRTVKPPKKRKRQPTRDGGKDEL